MSKINGRHASDWIKVNHPENGLFEVYWKDVNGPINGGITFNPEEGEGLRWKWYYKDGKRADGISQGWWPSGNLKCEWEWKNGNQNGLRIQWYDNGQKRSEGTFKDNKRDGLETIWYENGQKDSEIMYKDGEIISCKYQDEECIN